MPSRLRNYLRLFVPPVFGYLVQKVKGKQPQQIISWSGHFESWQDAVRNSTGYDSDLILNKCRESLLLVKSGKAVYERDSVIFDHIQYSWGLLAGLEQAALNNGGKLCVLDFGGSLGSTYFQNRDFLSPIKDLKWCIVEQTHFVDAGKQFFESENLRFYYTIEECISENKPNVLLLSSVIQYLEEPYVWLRRFLDLKFNYLILDRTAFVEAEDDMLTIQEVNEAIYQASYPSWFFSKKLMNTIKKEYALVAEFDNGFTGSRIVNKKNCSWTGVIFKR